MARRFGSSSSGAAHSVSIHPASVSQELRKAPGFMLQLAKRVRIDGKHASRQEPLAAFPELGDEGTAETSRTVYLVTLPHPKQERSQEGVKLVAPESMSKENVFRCFFDACAHPDYRDARALAAGAVVTLETGGLFRESHRVNDQGEVHMHDHLPIRAQRFRFLPVKRALLLRHGLASHWSLSHTGYWSAIRYCAVASQSKPVAALDAYPILWARGTVHPALEDCINEPITAAALRKRSWKATQAKVEEGKEAKVTEMDVWALVVRTKIQNTDEDPTAHLQLAECSLEVGVFKNPNGRGRCV